MTGKQIQKMRHALGESTTEFGKRFNVSGRTIEDWEQDRNKPNRWVQPLLKQLRQSLTEGKTHG